MKKVNTSIDILRNLKLNDQIVRRLIIVTKARAGFYIPILTAVTGITPEEIKSSFFYILSKYEQGAVQSITVQLETGQTFLIFAVKGKSVVLCDEYLCSEQRDFDFFTYSYTNTKF